MQAQTLSLTHSPFVPVAIGFFGLGAGYFVWGGQALFDFPKASPDVNKTMGMWVLTRHADVMAVMRDRSFSVGLIPQLITQQVERVADDRSGVDHERFQTLAQKSLVFTDNPGHGRLRRLANRVFTGKAVAKLRDRVTSHVEQLLKRAWDRGGMDAKTAKAAAQAMKDASTDEQLVAALETTRIKKVPVTRPGALVLQPGPERQRTSSHLLFAA